MLKGYPIKITMQTINVYDGKLYLGENALYFFPTEKENALKTGLKRGLYKAAYDLHASANNPVDTVISGVYKAAFDLHTPAKHNQKLEDENLPENITQEDLDTYVEKLPNAMKFEAVKIDKIQQNWIRKVIKYDGKNHGLPDGISKELKQVLKPWAEKNNVLIKGF